MLGFIKKDLAMIKSNFKLLGVIIIIFTVLGLLEEMDISFILPFICVMIMISTFSYDNYNKWDAYSVTIPNGRKLSVASKYITTIILTLVVSIITIILSLIISYVNNNTINYEQILTSMFGTIFGTLLVLTIMYPIIYKYGVEKARIGILIFTFGFVILVSLIAQFINLSSIAKNLAFLENYLILILIVIGILMVYISFKISERIFKKRLC